MKLALIDDDQNQLQLLHDMMTDVLDQHGIQKYDIQTFSGSAEFFSSWQPGSYDLIVLDIYLDTLTGIDIAQKIRENDQNVSLIFCTSSNEFASQSYEVNARYYLTKPVTPDKLNFMFQRVDLKQLDAQSIIQLPDGYRLLVRRLSHTSYANHLVTFYIQGTDPHSIYISQSEVERMLDQPCFYSANKGSIVNLHMVKKVTADSFLMKNGSQVPIPRRRYKEAKETYAKFHFKTLCEEVEQ